MSSGKFSRFVATNSDPDEALAQKNVFKLDFASLKQKGFINPAVRRSLISEEVRLIKRRLFQKMSILDDLTASEENFRDENEPTDIAHVIQVTSSKPGEGKSFLALNLALSIAMDEHYNVLLIDADVARCTITNILDLRREAGLTDILRAQDANLSTVLKRDKHYPFTFLPSGSGVASATDLFGGRKMKKLVSDIAHRYQDRIIIFDTPPLLAGTEALVLSHHVGQIVYVVDASQTPQSTVEAGLDLLDHYDNVSMVLNKTPQFATSDQFGAYYEYYSKSSTNSFD